MWRSFSRFSVNSFMWYSLINLQCIVPCSSVWTLDVTLFGESLICFIYRILYCLNPSIFILYQISSLFNVTKWVWLREHHSVLCSIINEIWLRGDTTVVHNFQADYRKSSSANYIKSMTNWRLEFNTSGYEGQWITLWCSYSLYDFAKHMILCCGWFIVWNVLDIACCLKYICTWGF